MNQYPSHCVLYLVMWQFYSSLGNKYEQYYCCVAVLHSIYCGRKTSLQFCSVISNLSNYCHLFLCRVHILVADLRISYHMWYLYQCFCKHQTGLEQHFSTRASQASLVKYDIKWIRRKSCRVFSKIFVWILCNQYTNKVMKFQHNTRYCFQNTN